MAEIAASSVGVKLKIIHTVAGVWTKTGGPASSIPALCSALSIRGLDVTLLTGEGQLAVPVLRLAGHVSVVTVPLGPYGIGHYTRRFSAACDVLGLEADILHTHGLWLHPNVATSATGRKRRKPIVISPRGMLSGWSLGERRLVKRIAWWLFQRRCLSEASLIHVTSGAERIEVREAGIEDTPIAVIPNGIDLDEYAVREIESTREERREISLLFLSRIHPKKGIDVLIGAWNRIHSDHPHAKLIIAGAGTPEHLAWLENRMNTPEADGVEYVGQVEGERKRSLLARARALVLPSHNENYGMVVAESLACGTPVVTTKGVPWPELEQRHCGWWVERSVESVAKAMDEALSLSDETIDEMGRRGRRLVEEEHSTGLAAERMEAAYLWILGKGDQPEFVSIYDR